MWSAQLDTIGTNYKAIAFNWRGFGQTAAEQEGFSTLADRMSVLDTTTNGEPAILVACPLRGRIGLDAALRQSSRPCPRPDRPPNVAGAPAPIHSPEIERLMAQSQEAEATHDLDRMNAMKARLLLNGPLAPEGHVAGPVRDLLLDMNGIALRSPPIGLGMNVPPHLPSPS